MWLSLSEKDLCEVFARRWVKADDREKFHFFPIWGRTELFLTFSLISLPEEKWRRREDLSRIFEKLRGLKFLLLLPTPLTHSFILPFIRLSPLLLSLSDSSFTRVSHYQFESSIETHRGRERKREREGKGEDSLLSLILCSDNKQESKLFSSLSDRHMFHEGREKRESKDSNCRINVSLNCPPFLLSFTVSFFSSHFLSFFLFQPINFTSTLEKAFVLNSTDLQPEEIFLPFLLSSNFSSFFPPNFCSSVLLCLNFAPFVNEWYVSFSATLMSIAVGLEREEEKGKWDGVKVLVRNCSTNPESLRVIDEDGEHGTTLVFHSSCNR